MSMTQAGNNNKLGKSIVPDWWEIIKILDVPFILLGSNGQILRANQSALEKLNYNEKDLKYCSILDLIHIDDRVKEVNNYIDITYSDKTVSTLDIRLKASEDLYLKAEQILQVINDPQANRKLVLLTFRIINDKDCKDKLENAENIIKSMNGLVNMLDLDEFGSSYNKGVVVKIRSKLNEFSNLISKSKNRLRNLHQ